jgi:hypothetical protein
MDESVVFVSKVDWLFLLSFVFAIAIMLGVSAIAIKHGGSGMVISVAVPGLMVVILPVWLLLTTRYTITDSELRVRSGPVDRHIALQDITGINPTRAARSSPALSLDRLEVRYGENGSILVSPKDKTGFAAALGFPLSQQQEVE